MLQNIAHKLDNVKDVVIGELFSEIDMWIAGFLVSQCPVSPENVHPKQHLDMRRWRRQHKTELEG